LRAFGAEIMVRLPNVVVPRNWVQARTRASGAYAKATFQANASFIPYPSVVTRFPLLAKAPHCHQRRKANPAIRGAERKLQARRRFLSDSIGEIAQTYARYVKSQESRSLDRNRRAGRVAHRINARLDVP
jgi:hypothetical protein